MNKEAEEALRIKSIFKFLPYVKLQEPGQLKLDYEVWAHLVDFYNRLDLYKLNIFLKSKQIGISWAIAARVLKKLYTTVGSNVLMLSSGQTEAQKLLEKTKIIYHNLPEWMKIYTLEPNSSEQFGFKEMRSIVRALPSTDKAGIGETSDWVIHDEAEFHDFFELNLGHTLATVADDPGRELTIVSTVDKTKPDSYFKKLWKGGIGSGYPEANSFHSKFYAYAVRPNRDEAWYEEIKKQNEATPWVVEANYPRTVEEALSPQSAQSCFNKERLEKLWGNIIEKPETRQGFIYILYPPSVGTQYVGGVDVGEGVGLDYSCLTIVGKSLSSEVAAVIYSNEVATDLFAYECDKLCGEYFNPLLAVENNSLGIAVTNKLLELGTKNLYYSDSEKKKVGWTTGEKNKQLGIIELIQVINDGSLSTRFKPQVKEIMEYQWLNGKPQPTGATHGDTVISLMLANQMLKRVGPKQEASMYLQGRRIW